MHKKDKIVAFIPVRGGSKSIPLKNIKIINGKPLVYWTLDAACKCKYIDRVYISTDSQEIVRVVNHYHNPKIMIFNRSAETATDTASTESSMIEFAENVQFETIVLIQATSPLLSEFDLDNAIQKFLVTGVDSMISVVRQRRFIWNVYEDILINPQNYNPQNRPRRQDFDGFLVENGAFYVTYKNCLLSSKCRISGKISYYEMCEESYFEIDNPSDWIIIENLLKYKKRKEPIELIAKKIKLFVMDCDGVLTDAGMYYSSNGELLKKFNTKDGMGIKLLHSLGIKTAIITGENSEIVTKRAEKLNIKDVYLNANDKLDVLNKVISKYKITLEEVAYIGDDINDLDILKVVGLPCTVNDAVNSVKEKCLIVSNNNGGCGAVREIIDNFISYRNSK